MRKLSKNTKDNEQLRKKNLHLVDVYMMFMVNVSLYIPDMDGMGKVEEQNCHLKIGL